jgi:hypothetical protein
MAKKWYGGTSKLEERAEEGIGKGEMVSPLSFQGHKGGNPESPEPEPPEDFEPRDPMGFLPEGATERGKSGPGYGGKG